MPCPYNLSTCALFSVLSVSSVVNSFTQQRFDGLKQRLRFQDHAFAAAKRAVVNGAMAVVRVCAQVVHAYVHQMRFARPPHDPVIERTTKKVRKNSYNVELHGWHSVPQRNSAAIQFPQSIGEHDVDALGFHVDANAELRGQRQQHLALTRVNSQQRDAAGEFDVTNRAYCRRGAHFPDFASNQLTDVIISGIELRALFERYLHFASAQARRGFHIFNAVKMKDGFSAAAGRKPASLNLRSAGRATAIREPHFAQTRQTFGEISQDFRSHFAAETARAQNSRQGNSDEDFRGHSIRGFRV
jgi:hypothetical protein